MVTFELKEGTKLNENAFIARSEERRVGKMHLLLPGKWEQIKIVK